MFFGTGKQRLSVELVVHMNDTYIVLNKHASVFEKKNMARKCPYHRRILGKTKQTKQPVPAFSCADPESFVRGSPTLKLFCIDEGREDPNTPINAFH